MNFSLSVPKGLQLALEERGINMKGLGASEMRAILSHHDDFKKEKVIQYICFLSIIVN